MLPEIKEKSFQLDRRKLKDLVHYICYRCSAAPEKLGKTKLHKILHYSDLQAYLSLNKPITGEVYKKDTHGPVSEHLTEIIDELVEEGRINKSLTVRYGKYLQNQYVANSLPNVESFTAQEISIVEQKIDLIANHFTAKDISDVSHNDVHNMLSRGDRIPYYMAYYYILEKPSTEGLAWAKKQVKEMGLV